MSIKNNNSKKYHPLPGTIASQFQSILNVKFLLPCISGLIFALSSVYAWDTWTNKKVLQLNILMDYLIPYGALLSLLVSSLLSIRYFVTKVEEKCLPQDEKRQKFGRKALIMITSSILIIASCVYRAFFIASEGAAACRGPSSIFNAPVSGRTIATVGELAFVVQITSYIDGAAVRLKLKNQVFAKNKFIMYMPAVLAECFSWTGVLMGNAQFFCLEYCCWVIIAFCWTWDGAELLHLSKRWGDNISHATLICGALALLFFNLGFEIPHFLLNWERSSTSTEVPSMWECVSMPNSPLWLKRLPFFFCYFFGCSWSSTAILYRFFYTASVLGENDTTRNNYGDVNKKRV